EHSSSSRYIDCERSTPQLLQTQPTCHEEAPLERVRCCYCSEWLVCRLPVSLALLIRGRTRDSRVPH
ncbi:hypothetical protein TSAR_006894, partial [Trichomalopsis sarcophagae]